MSYIIDALRKSEQERRQGEMPHLGSGDTLILRQKGKTPVWVYLLMALAVLNLAFLGYWLSTRHSQHAVEPVAANQEQVNPLPAGQERVNPGPVEQAAADAPVNLPPRPATTPESTLVQRVADHRPATALKPIPEPKSVAKTAAVAAEQPTRIEPTRNLATEEEPVLIQQRTRSTAQPPSPTQQQQRQPSTTAALEGELIQPRTPQRNRPPQASQESATAGATTPSSSAASVSTPIKPARQLPPHVSELSLSARQGIPALAFNSHIYSSDRSARRVIVNDLYMQEGDAFQGLIVEEITAEGAIFSHNGQRFRMKALTTWAP